MLSDMTLFRAAMMRPGQQQARLELHRPARVIRAMAVTLGLACGATLAATPIAATGAQAFGFGDVWDGVKEVGGAISDVTGAARDAKNKVENTVRDAAGKAVKEVGGKVYGSIKDKVPAGVKRLGNDMKGAGELAGKVAKDFDKAQRLPETVGGLAKLMVKECVIDNRGCPFEPKPGTIIRDKRKPTYRPDRVGPTKSQAVVGSKYKPGEWGGNGSARGKTGAAATKGAPLDRRISKSRGKVVTKGTDTGNPYPGYPNRRPYGDYPSKLNKVSKPGKAPATKAANVARDRSAAGHALGKAKDTVARDRSAMGRPLTPVRKRASNARPRDKQTVVRDKRGKRTVVRDKRTKTTVVRDERRVNRKATNLMRKRVKRLTDHRVKRSMNHRVKRRMDHRARRAMDHRSRRTMDHRSGRTNEWRRSRGANRRFGGRRG